uniref:Uncharacterized protein n=1 Tax=Rhabditophanes sp. KR3021 TaxID=114890 RepID=A0AC35UI07_9BILA
MPNQKSSTKDSSKSISKGSKDACVDNPAKGSLLFIEFHWRVFDTVIIGQLIMVASMLLHAFLLLAFGSTFNEICGYLVLALYLFLPTLPAYKCMANADAYAGVAAFSILQLLEGMYCIIKASFICIENSNLPTQTIMRLNLIYMVCVYQFVSVVAVSTIPFRKIGLADVEKLMGTKKSPSKKIAP